MKKIILIFALFCMTNMWSQPLKMKDTSTMVSVISTNKDTLYLINNDIGYKICESWYDVPEKKRPVFIFKEKKWIIENKIKNK